MTEKNKKFGRLIYVAKKYKTNIAADMAVNVVGTQDAEG